MKTISTVILTLALGASVHAQLSDVTQPGDPIVPTSNNSPGSENVANAIDNQVTKYLNFDKLNTGFTVSPTVGLTIVSGLTLTSGNDAPERDPASYTLSGSYDGSNFTTIASGSVPAFPGRFFKNTIPFDNEVPYLHYRLIFPTVANAAAANSMQIAEVELLGVLAPTDVTVPGDAIVATSNNSPGSEGVANAIDNQPAKYLNFDKLNTGFTVTPGAGDTIVIGLTLTSANDAPERDPASYDLSGSNDGMNFVPISNGPVPQFPARFYKNYIFFPDNTNAFKSYRLIFPTVANAAAANSMQVSEVEFLGVTPGVTNTNPATDLIATQPVDTPVLPGSMATFRVVLAGPWQVQWHQDGAPIPGATTATYTTPPATAADDGTLFRAVVQSPHGVQTSDEVMLSIFTPSATESIGLSWRGAFANGAPTDMLPDDITGFHQQAYWNNLAGSSGTLAQPRTGSNVAQPTITVDWVTSGEWGSGTGVGDPTERMLNGICTSFSTTEGSAQSVTFSGVPPGNHSLLLYTVQTPFEFFNMDFIVKTHDFGGNDVIQRRYSRPLNSGEYNSSPGFSLVTADTPQSRGVGNMMRFDNLQPGPDGIIQIGFFSPGRVDLPGGGVIRGPGLNGLQLLLNPPPVPSPPIITQEPVSANSIIGGHLTLNVNATGPNLTYRWLKNADPIAGATSPQLALCHLSTNDSGIYFVEISNAAGTVRSRTAVVDVLANGQIALGQIAYFKLNDGGADGFTALNSAGGGQNGQIQGSFADFTPGQVGNALSFDQSFVNYVVVPDYPKVSTAITVAGWVQSFSDEWGPIINNWVEANVGASGQFQVEVVPDNFLPMLRVQIEVGPNRVRVSAPVDGTLNFWHHFAISANGVTLSIYWDGQLLGSVDYVGTINTTPAIPWLSLGANLDTSMNPVGMPFSGAMDDLALWNRSLSRAEIQAIYSGGLSGQEISQVPPVLTGGTCPPTITCSTNIVVECTGGLTAVNYTVTAVDSSGAPIPVVCVPPSGAGFRLGTSNVVCTARDSLGNSSSCTFTVTVVDTSPPQVTCNSNITANATSASGAVVTYIASASDPCGITSFDCVPPSGSAFPIGMTTVVCRATDGTGNTNSCSFTVTVTNCPVTISCPTNFSVQCLSSVPPCPTSLAAFLALGGTASDNCNSNLTYTCSDGPLIGGVCGGTIARTHCVTDGGTNTACCVQIVTVHDTIPPVITCATDRTNEWVTGSVPVFDNPTATDNCDGFVILLDAAQEPGGGGGTGTGSGTVTLSGNTLLVNLTFSGLSANSTAAHIHGPAGRGTNAAVLYPLTLVPAGATAGVIGQTVTLVNGTGGFTIAQQLQQFQSGLWYVNVHTTAHPGGEVRGQIDPNVVTTFVDTELPATCPAVRIFRRTWTATDACTNSASCSQTISFLDRTPPVITCPTNLTVSCLSNVPPRPTSLAAFLALGGTASDNCDTNLSYTCTDGSLVGGTCSGTISRTHSVTDDCTNAASCVQLITVLDDVAPTIAGASVDKDSLWPPNHKMHDVTVNYTATDHCDSNVTCVLSVTSNEPINGTGDGDTAPDWEIVDAHHVRLRAERAGTGNGRVYTIAIVCSDCSGNTIANPVHVVVAHDIKSPVSGAAFKVNTAVGFTGTFWDRPGNRHTAYWTFDNLSAWGSVTEPSGPKNGVVKGSYKFGAPGVYKVTLFIKDQSGVTSWVNTAGDTEAIVVIYDPNGGYTIGGGWITSPPGAYAADPSLTGKLSFGFSSQYFKGAANPKGETLVKFLAGNLEFNALNFDYLSISGARAQFRGFGKINGVSGYNFLLTVIDGALGGGGGVDKFRLKIWEKITGVIIYDNEAGHSDADNPVTAVGEASSVIIKK